VRPQSSGHHHSRPQSHAHLAHPLTMPRGDKPEADPSAQDTGGPSSAAEPDSSGCTRPSRLEDESPSSERICSHVLGLAQTPHQGPLRLMRCCLSRSNCREEDERQSNEASARHVAMLRHSVEALGDIPERWPTPRHSDPA
jgi:hypothetical protein